MYVEIRGKREMEAKLVRVLQGCNSFRKLLKIHAYLIVLGLPHLTDKLLHFCAVSTSGSLPHASLVFRHLPDAHRTPLAWNSLIRGFSSRSPLQALALYNRMLASARAPPDEFTFSFALKASDRVRSSAKCREIHGRVLRGGFGDHVVVSTNLVRCYGGNSLVEDARSLFDEMSQRDLVAWNAMIAFYSQAGCHSEVFLLYDRMRSEDVGLDSFTLVGLLGSCAHVGAMSFGAELHKTARGMGIDTGNVFVGNALIDMYAKCGCLDGAIQVFNGMKKRDVLTWNSVIVGFGVHGFGREAISYFRRMLVEGVQPNAITFLGLLLGCCHQGLLEEGLEYFNQMYSRYNIRPGIKHYGCVVDLYGRAGRLQKAIEIISSCPSPDDPVLWRILLGSCKIHKNVEVGRIALTNLVQLGALDAGDCVLMATIYAEVHDALGVARMRKLIKKRGIKTTPGWSWIEVFDQVHRFIVDDQSHPETKMIYLKLEEVTRQLHEIGYAKEKPPSTMSHLHLEECSNTHSEKLAIAFGLAKTPEGTALRIVKNLRVCRDCHSFTKLVSRAFKRNIVVRDRVRFHHFSEGRCSCGDYW